MSSTSKSFYYQNSSDDFVTSVNYIIEIVPEIWQDATSGCTFCRLVVFSIYWGKKSLIVLLSSFRPEITKRWQIGNGKKFKSCWAVHAIITILTENCFYIIYGFLYFYGTKSGQIRYQRKLIYPHCKGKYSISFLKIKHQHHTSFLQNTCMVTYCGITINDNSPCSYTKENRYHLYCGVF